MCGICGIVNFDGCPIRENEIQDMMNAVKHRGPDDEGIFMDKREGQREGDWQKSGEGRSDFLDWHPFLKCNLF